MNVKQLILKCYAKKDHEVWIAVCLDLCLATQGGSLEEAKRKLEEQIFFYVSEALEDKEYGAQLLKRSAPLSSWIEYYLLSIKSMIRNKTSVIFDELMPLRHA